jgi:hypothetical protein
MGCFAARFAILLTLVAASAHGQARFDLDGPKVDIRVSRAGMSLPIAAVPNLQAGDVLWLHPDLPSTQSVHYLLIAAFLRGTTNPPPDDWFTRIETWKKEVREEGVFITVPPEAEQAVLFLAPETIGDFSTLRSAVQGRPGIFVRATQDLTEASFEQSRVETYLADMKRVPPSPTASSVLWTSSTTASSRQDRRPCLTMVTDNLSSIPFQPAPAPTSSMPQVPRALPRVETTRPTWVPWSISRVSSAPSTRHNTSTFRLSPCLPPKP